MFNILVAPPEPLPVSKMYTVQELKDQVRRLPCSDPIIIKTKDGKTVIIKCRWKW